MSEPRIFALVPAAGAGRRYGRSGCAKQYLKLGSKTIIEHSILALLTTAEQVWVAIDPQDSHWPGLNIAKHPRVHFVNGGDSRSVSVRNALRSLSEAKPGNNDWVLIHDAVRPLLRQRDLQSLLSNLRQHPVGGLLATPLYDTVKRIDANNDVVVTEDRTGLWTAQTPQMFRYEHLLTALNRFGGDESITDEALAMERAGHKIRVVEGARTNIKITRPVDLEFAESMLDSIANEPD